MVYPKIEDCIERVGCKYTLTVIVAKRAKELTAKMPGEFVDGKTKELSYALGEVANGKIIPVFATGS